MLWSPVSEAKLLSGRPAQLYAVQDHGRRPFPGLLQDLCSHSGGWRMLQASLPGHRISSPWMQTPSHWPGTKPVGQHWDVFTHTPGGERASGHRGARRVGEALPGDTQGHSEPLSLPGRSLGAACGPRIRRPGEGLASLPPRVPLTNLKSQELATPPPQPWPQGRPSGLVLGPPRLGAVTPSAEGWEHGRRCPG